MMSELFQRVAWVDLLGFGDVVKEDQPQAMTIWRELHASVTEHVLGHDDSAEVYGINDGFFVRSASPSQFVDGLITLYQEWFRTRTDGGGANQLPLLRGCLCACDSGDVAIEPSGAIKSWLVGPAFGTAYEYEDKLRGGRLFATENVRQDFTPEFWHWFTERSGYGITSNQDELAEILWPFSNSHGELMDRFHRIGRLVDTQLANFPTLGPEGSLGKQHRAYLHYDETLKTTLRAVGRYLKRFGDPSQLFLPALTKFLHYRPERINFTWGLSFEALEAISQIRDLAASTAKESILMTLNFLKDAGDKARFGAEGDFCRELKKRDSADFLQWIRNHYPEIDEVCRRSGCILSR